MGITIDDEKPREPQIITDNANEAKLTLQNFIFNNLNSTRCANLLLFIGVLDGNVDFVERALDNGADINHAMSVEEKRILEVAGYNLTLERNTT